MTDPIRLSKSRVISGLQCERRLWLETFRRELREADAGRQIIFDSGNELGELARQLYGPGTLVEYVDDIARAIAETSSLLATEPTTLFEPAFVNDHVVVRADVLRPATVGYDLIEVKASTSVKDYYIDDCATQAWAIENSGTKLSRIYLAHLDNTFVYKGDGDYRGLLNAEDVTTAVRERMAKVPQWVDRFRKMLESPEPNQTTGAHCDKPFSCPFYSHCRSQEPPESEFPVTLLPRGGKVVRALLAEGYIDLRDVPASRLENPIHQLIHAATLSCEPFYDAEAGKTLAQLSWPRYYLDFETIGFAVPRWAGTRPYQQIPFQWSCQVEQRDGSLLERAFIDLSGDSPLRAFAESLLAAAGTYGPILVYNQSFEEGRVRDLASQLPDLAPELLALTTRMFDLLPLARDSYYHHDMKGSWSIKAVLPTIAPELSYEALDDVADGTDAQIAYRVAAHPDTPATKQMSLEQALRRYCGNDTMGLVKLVAKLTETRNGRFTGTNDATLGSPGALSD